MIQYILWDLDGTLLDSDKMVRATLSQCFKHFSLGVCTDNMIDEYIAINELYWKLFEKCVITRSEMQIRRFIDFFNMFDIDVSLVPSFSNYYNAHLGEEAWNIKNSIYVLKTLQENGIRQYIATNGTREMQMRKLTSSGLIDFVDSVFISDDIKSKKPEKDFFDYIMAQIECTNPKEVLMIGDSLHSDIVGGILSKLITCWFNPKKRSHDDVITPDFEIYELLEVINIIQSLQ